MATFLMHKNRILANQSNDSNSYNLTPETWTRPADWLPVPTLIANTEIVYTLVEIRPNFDNYIAVNCAGNYTVDWGDGTVTNYATGTNAQRKIDFTSVTSIVNSDGNKMLLLTITPQAGQSLTSVTFPLHSDVKTASYIKNILEIHMSAPSCSTLTISGLQRLFYFDYIGTNLLNTSQNRFSNCENLRKINRFDTSNHNQNLAFYQTFSNCFNLLEIPNLTINNIPSLRCDGMFSNCYKIKTIPNLNFSTCINATSMFSGCISLLTIPLINTSLVTTMASMFSGCYELREVPLLNTINVTTMANMFQSTRKLKTFPAFNMSNVTSIYQMFYQASGLETWPEGLDYSKITNIGYFIAGTSPIKYFPAATFPLVTSALNAFSGTKIESTGLLTFPICNNYSSMFLNCYYLTNPQLNLTPVAGTNFSSMFSSCIALVNQPYIDTSLSTNIQSMFSNCSSLVNTQQLDSLNNNNLSLVYNQCPLIKSADIINTSSVTSINQLFYQCSAMVSATTMNLVACTNYTNAFSFCSNLLDIPISNSNALTTLNSTFNSTIRLRTIKSMSWANVNAAVVISSSYSLSSFLPYGCTRGISFNACNLSRDAIVTMFNNLGVASGVQTIDVRLTPGAAYLTAQDRLICTNKGFTLLY